MKDRFYVTILSNEYSLFYSRVTNKWGKLSECRFFSNDLLAVTNGVDDALQSELYHVASVLHLPVVDIPSTVWDIVCSSANFSSQIIDDENFFDYFYNQSLSKFSVAAKTAIVAASLIKYANNMYNQKMVHLMQSTPCIPCSPDGNVFKKPQNVIHPDSEIAKLFSPEDGMYPDKKFLQRNSILLKALDDIGLMQLLPWKTMLVRARCVKKWYEENHDEALKCLFVLLDCIESHFESKNLKYGENDFQHIPLLPVMPKPQHYPISWEGDSFRGCLSPGAILTKVSDFGLVNAVYACGSQVVILDTKILSQHKQHYSLTYNLQKILGIKNEIALNNVIKNFDELLQWSQSQHEVSDEMLGQVSKITTHIYKYFDNKLSTPISKNYPSALPKKFLSKMHSQKRDITDRCNLQQYLSRVKDRCCIWVGRKFILPTCVSCTWKIDGPYLYKVPGSLSKSTALISQLGIQDEFSTQTYIRALSKMKSDYGERSLPKECETVVRLIVPGLNSDANMQDLFLPDKDFVLRKVMELKYNDAPWCTPDKEYIYCHEFVEREVALCVGVEPVRSTLLQDHYIFSDESGEEFGQEEKLTQRLHNILRDYPCDITFLKEILQNADDAGATKLYITLDKRNHNIEKVISKQWEELQGPALLIWNDSVFSDEDLIGIQKIGLGSKGNDAGKIGQYGIGFNVVYHFTDCPSFICNDRLCILDPHYYYIANNKHKKPGKMYKDLETLWQKFPDMKSSYLLNDLGEIPEMIKMNGSLFRLPLRQSAKHSEITEEVLSVENLETKLRDWVSHVAETLLFVHNINEIKLFVIDEEQSTENLTWNNSNLVFYAHSDRGEEATIKVSDTGSAKLFSYPMTLFTKGNQPTKWIIQLGEGNVEEDVDWNKIKPLNAACHPHHGIAAPIQMDKFEGKAFCFLPLPGTTHLPMHIHGDFILHSNRRCLWVSSSTKNKVIENSESVFAKDDDPNDVWNDALITAIAVSYAHFLTNLTGSIKPPVSQAMIMQSFYSYFPSVSHGSLDIWSHLAALLYKTLYKLNAPVLAKLTEQQSSDGKPSVSLDKSNVEKLYNRIDWYKLLMHNSQDECFFHNEALTIVNVLKSIGMNLINAPVHIRTQFKTADENVKLSVVSKESVIKYYSQFSYQVLNGNTLPCPVSSTRFSEIRNLSLLLGYLMKREAFTGDYKHIANLGFLVTVDENLHAVSDGKNIISSNSWTLFPSSKHHFIHADLQIYYPLDSKYLCTFNPETNDHLKCIISIFQDNYPSSYTKINSAWIRSIFNCLTDDPAFSVHCDEILNQFRLLPASNNKLYSTQSDILPLTSTAGKFCDRPDYNVEKVKKLLTTLNVPLLRHELVGNIHDKVKMQLPSVLNPPDILKSLYLAKNEESILNLSEQDLSVLFTVFRQISYSNKDNQKYIRHLPVFTTISGENVTLSLASLIFIWNGREACSTGRDQWIKHISSDVIFLDSSAPWACIEHEIIKNLRIKQINRYDIYCDFIFPNFHFLDEDVQKDHLSFIKREIYPNCEHTLLHSNEYSKVQRVNSFISAFRKLKCICDGFGKLRSIESFNNHNDMLFQTFCGESHFLPDSFREEQWYEFLVYFGLKTVPTIDEFIAYCKWLPNMGNTDTIKDASSVLLSALFFSPKTGENKCEKLQSSKCICDIPIAVVVEMPDLNSIMAQKMGEHIVKCSDSTVYLTRLSGSSTVDNKHLLWTIRPLIVLPCDPDHQRMEHFGIVWSPSVNDVVVNLTSLSCTAFASYSRFERHDAGYLADKSSLLPIVVVSMLKYIQKKLNEPRSYTEDSFEYICKKHNLSNTKFLPVKLQTNSKEYALVKPTQVLYTAPQFMEPLSSQTSPITLFYPYLHPLIEEAYGVFDVLSHIGVQISITFSHVQLVLQLAKSKCQDNEVDINTKHVILKAVDELIKLLQNNNDKRNITQCLKPLYLLSQGNTLIECSRLIVFDIVGLHQFSLPSSYAYLNPLKDDKKVRSRLLLELLPKDLGLKSLKSMLEYDVIDSTQAEEVFPNVSIIGDILLSKEFRLGIELLGRCCSNDDSVHTSVTNVLKNFQCNITIQHLNTLKVKPKIKIDNKTVPLDNTISHWRFFLQKYADQKWMLSLKNTVDDYPSSTYSNLAKQLCSRLKLNLISCFEVSSDDDLLDLIEFVSLMLKCQSISKVSEVIRKNIPSYFTSDIDLPCQFNDSIDPKLGDTIAEYWHFRLDQNILNLFWPEVGYETESGDIVYAQILHEIVQDSSVQVVNNEQKMMQRKFLIEIGKDEPIEVDVLELYKFIQNDGANDQGNTSADMVVYDGPEIQTQQEIDFEAIRAAVKAAMALPDEKRQKAIKRLYLKHHPDKNSNPNATAEFQFLKKEIDKATKEAYTENTDGKQAYSSPHPNWGSCYSQWNQTASSHSKFKSAGGQSSAWNIPNPHKDLREAKVWIKQAYYDYTAQCVLKTASETDDEVSAATCFMCHEVAEKSLKAGMYAKCGISPGSLSKHNVIILARALVQLQCPIDVIDAHSLERFYLDSRFPNVYSPSAAPGDKFDSHTAQQAFEAATRIFEVMKQVIADDT